MKLLEFGSSRTRLCILVLLVFVPAMALVLHGNLQQQRLEKVRVREAAGATASMAAARVEHYVKQTRQLLATLAQFPFLTLANNRPFAETNFLNLRLLSPDFLDFGLIEKDGSLFCHVPDPEINDAKPDLSSFEPVVKSQRFSMGSLYPASGTNALSLQFGYPVTNAQGGFERVLYASLAVSVLARSLTEIHVPHQGVLNVIDPTGTVIVRFPESENWIGTNISHTPFLELTLRGDPIYEAVGLDGVKRIFATANVTDGQFPILYVVVGVPVEASFAAANQALVRNLGIMAGMAAVLLMTAWLVSERMFLRPLAAMLSASTKLREGDLSARTGVRGNGSELHQLAGSFDQMAESLEARRKELEDANAAIRKMNTELEARVQARTAQLQMANQELESFSYSVSHDLRAPLRHMDGFAKLLSREPAVESDPECQRYIKIITNAARQMGNLIEDLLSFSRMGRQSMAIRIISTDELVHGIVEELKQDSNGRQIEWHIGDLPSVTGDLAMLKQAWVNLLSNAVKYTRGQSPARIEIHSREEEQETIFTIKDNGAGFDMKYADKLFGVFQRLHREEEFEGTGIGLANVRRIISRHGGRVWAEGAPGKGAAFHFSLPVKDSDPSGTLSRN